MKKPQSKTTRKPKAPAKSKAAPKAAAKPKASLEPIMFSNEAVDRDPSLVAGMREVAHNGSHKWYLPE